MTKKSNLNSSFTNCVVVIGDCNVRNVGQLSYLVEGLSQGRKQWRKKAKGEAYGEGKSRNAQSRNAQSRNAERRNAERRNTQHWNTPRRNTQPQLLLEAPSPAFAPVTDLFEGEDGLLEMRDYTAATAFDGIFKSIISLDKVKQALSDLLDETDEHGERLFMYQKEWYVVFLKFKEHQWLQKCTATDFCKWAVQTFGERGKCSAFDFKKVSPRLKNASTWNWTAVYAWERPYVLLSQALEACFWGGWVAEGSGRFYVRESRFTKNGCFLRHSRFPEVLKRTDRGAAVRFKEDDED